jgi:class 3 adenylate cyclase
LVSTGGAACFSAGFIGDALGAAFGAPLATAFCLGCAFAAVGLFWPAAASASLSWLFF